MTVRAYKTWRLGPLRVTVSRSGLSWSVGSRRARVGERVGPHGSSGPRVSVKVPGSKRWRIRRG